MKIINYNKKKMCADINELFLTIYPDWSTEGLQRVTYNEDHHLHVATKVAIKKKKVVGQANVFRIKNDSDIANLGYHVHPEYRRKGIGEKLSNKVIKKAIAGGIKIIIIQTEKGNSAAVNLAEKMGFGIPPQSFLEENSAMLKYKRINNGICLYKNLTIKREDNQHEKTV